MPRFALEGITATLKFRQRLRAWVDDDTPRLAIDDNCVARCEVFQQIRRTQHGRQGQGAGHDRRMTFDAAQNRCCAGDLAGVDLRHVGGRQLIGHNDAARRRRRKRAQRFSRQVADDPIANFADIFQACRNIGIVHGLKCRGNLKNFALHRRLGVNPLVFNARVGAAHEPRVVQHLLIGLQQEAKFFG